MVRYLCLLFAMLAVSINAYASYEYYSNDGYSDGYGDSSDGYYSSPVTADNWDEPRQPLSSSEYAYNDENNYRGGYYRHSHHHSYSSRLSSTISSSEKTIIVDPRVHRWGAYQNGKLIRSGMASAGSSWCNDLGRPCRTRSGVFHIQTLGSSSCVSKKFPLGEGGAPMPYCMYFNGGQGLHGSYEVADANISHGCVRMEVSDAHWLRFNFANIGTKVVVRSY